MTEENFKGFPNRMEFTPIPNLFFSTILPKISDISELKTTIHALATLYRKRGFPRFVTLNELLGNKSLMSSLSGVATPPEEVLHNALEAATQRGIFLHLVLDKDGAPEDIYLMNTENDRQTVTRIESGELQLSGLKTTGRAYVETEELPDIFTLYEQNIGMLTPIIADELREAEKIYPEDWIKDAIKEAVNQNKRKKSYIMAILERWSTEGRSDGTYRRDSAQSTSPDKYNRQRYGHMVRR